MQKYEYPIEILDFLNNIKGTKTLTSRSGGLNSNGILLQKMIMEYSLNHLLGVEIKDCKNLILHGLKSLKCSYCECEITGSNLVRKSPYCNKYCYKKSDDGKLKISKIKKALYSDPQWKKLVENKKVSTCLKNNGVLFPMQSTSIFEKHEKSSHQSYIHRGISGVRGYECHIIDWLIDKFNFAYEKHFIMGYNAKNIFDQKIICSGSHRYPDIYVIPWNMYIEVKGEYTLSKFSILEDMVNIVENLGSDYKCILYNKTGIFEVEPHTRKLILLKVNSK